MQDGIDTFDQLMHGSLVGKIADLNFLAAFGRFHLSDIGQSQGICVRLQCFAQNFAQATCRTCEQEAIEGILGGVSRSHENAPDCYYFVICCRMTIWIIGTARVDCQRARSQSFQAKTPVSEVFSLQKPAF
jgi:hypothetical protein